MFPLKEISQRKSSLSTHQWVRKLRLLKVRALEIAAIYHNETPGGIS